MKILVDADACPVKSIIEDVAKKYDIPVILLADTSHVLSSSYSEVVMVSKAPDAVDFALINRTTCGDIVITQDYGVAAMALGKKAYAIHPNGRIYSEDTIDQMLMERHIAKKVRRAGEKAGKGQKKRTVEADEKFTKSLHMICQLAKKENKDEINLGKK